MPIDPMNPRQTKDGSWSKTTNDTYLVAQVELGGKLVISSDETHPARRLEVVSEP